MPATIAVETVSWDPALVDRRWEPALDECILRCAEGDEAALATLYDETSARVYGLALRVLRDRSAAEEVTIEVYVQAYRNASRFDSTRGTPLGWLLNMARSRAIDRVRAESTRRTHETRFATLASLPPESSDPDTLTELTERCRPVRHALDALDPDLRRVIELAYFEGLSQSQIAARLGHPLGTVKTRTRRGMMCLRQYLAAAD